MLGLARYEVLSLLISDILELFPPPIARPSLGLQVPDKR